MTGTELALLMGALLTGMAGLITATVNSRASATKTQFDALKEMIEIGHEEIERLKTQVKEAIAENRELRLEIKALQCEIVDRDNTLEHVKRWAEMLVHALKINGIEIPPMPDREITKPRKAA